MILMTRVDHRDGESREMFPLWEHGRWLRLIQ
jgi:hypothetical protein